MKICRTITLLWSVFLLLFLSGTAFASRYWSEPGVHQEKGIVVIGSDDTFGRIYGVSIPEQKKLWEIKLEKTKSANIVVEGDIAYIGGEGEMFGEVLAVNIQDGKPLWIRKFERHRRVSNMIVNSDTVYYVCEEKFRDVVRVRVYALNKSDGKDKWSSSFCQEGLFKDFFKTSDDNFILIYQSMTKPANPQNKPEKIIQLLKIDAQTGQDMWNCPINGSLDIMPIDYQNVIYFAVSEMVKEGDGLTFKGSFQAVDGESGNVIVNYPITEDDKIYGSPVFVEDNVLLFTKEGKIICLKAGEDGLKWQLPLNAPPFTGLMEKDGILLAVTSLLNEDKTRITKVYGISLSEGNQLWEKEIEGTLESPLLQVDDMLLAGVSTKEDTKFEYKLFALGIADGVEKWMTNKEGKYENTLVIEGGNAYFMVNYKKTKEGETQERIFHDLVSCSLTDGSINWNYETESSISTQLRFTDDLIDFGTKEGGVISIKSSDGQEQFKFSFPDEDEIDSVLIPHGEFFGFVSQGADFVIIDKKGNMTKRMEMTPWFADWKAPIFLGCLILSAAISWFIYHARKGKDLFIRKIAGLNAIDEAVGRSTEMGKPVLYITGLADVDDIQTLASLSIMGHIAQKTAEYDTPLIVPCCRSVVMSTAQEVVKESYMKAGRPDTYRRENIHYLTDDQFGYVAGVDGIMVREKPAANFYMGKFYAESLILAETGHSTGAIQIAGTAEAAQLPFFVAACDYTLIGEELFAASAYLSKDVLQVGSLKGQDLAKAIILFAILMGCILETMGNHWFTNLITTR